MASGADTGRPDLAPDRGRHPGHVRAAVDAAPDGLPQGREQANRVRRAGELPVLPRPVAQRRGGADRRARPPRVHGAEPVPLQRRPHAGLPVPARGRLHGTGRGRVRRTGRPHPALDPGAAHRVGRAGLQRRDEPRRRGQRRHRRPPAPARGAALGRRHQLHARRRARPRSSPSFSGTPANSSAEAWPGSTPVRPAGTRQVSRGDAADRHAAGTVLAPAWSVPRRTLSAILAARCAGGARGAGRSG